MKDNVINTIKNTVVMGASVYSPITGIVAIVATETLDGFIKNYTGIKVQKVQKFWEEFQDWLNEELKGIDTEFLNKPYFHEILEIILLKASSSSNEIKIAKFQEILRNRVKAAKSNDFSRTYLDIVEKITEEQFDLLYYIFKNQPSGTYLDCELICKALKMEKGKFNLNAHDLISKGLIVQNNLGGNPSAVHTTALGDEFLKFIDGRN